MCVGWVSALGAFVICTLALPCFRSSVAFDMTEYMGTVDSHPRGRTAKLTAGTAGASSLILSFYSLLRCVSCILWRQSLIAQLVATYQHLVVGRRRA